MIELGQFAREERLRFYLEQPWLQPFNGVEGIALSYDERLVLEADRLIGGALPAQWRGTLEYSRYIAMLLAAVAERWEGSSRREMPDDGMLRFMADRLSDWWRWHAQRIGEEKRSPIVFEISVGKTFGIEARPDREFRREYPYELRIRRSRGARLQAATSGGWIARSDARRKYGTTGGFIVDAFSNQTYSLTAAHVCGDLTGHARAMPLPRAMLPLRRGAGELLGLLGVGRFRSETCSPFWSSWPDIVGIPQCALSTTPHTDGLDVALHQVGPKQDLTPVSIADLADVSPLLELSFRGATSGSQRVAVSGFTLWHSYELDGSQVCIHDCLQIKLMDRPYVRTDLSRGGDSGSWLIARGITGLHWAGLLTGGDGDRAGIVPARRIVDRIEDQLGLSVLAYV